MSYVDRAQISAGFTQFLQDIRLDENSPLSQEQLDAYDTLADRYDKYNQKAENFEYKYWEHINDSEKKQWDVEEKELIALVNEIEAERSKRVLRSFNNFIRQPNQITDSFDTFVENVQPNLDQNVPLDREQLNSGRELVGNIIAHNEGILDFYKNGQQEYLDESQNISLAEGNVRVTGHIEVIQNMERSNNAFRALNDLVVQQAHITANFNAFVDSVTTNQAQNRSISREQQNSYYALMGDINIYNANIANFYNNRQHDILNEERRNSLAVGRQRIWGHSVVIQFFRH